MYQKLYESIPDVSAYLERLGISSVKKPDRDFLDELIYAHQCRIIFENLDICDFHRPLSLEIPALFEKIVVGKRGGYCFELNALFAQLLRDLGYCADSCLCRIVRGRDFIPPVLHRGILVGLEDGLYYCDVGFGGPQPPGAVPIKDGASAELHGERFHTRQIDEHWWRLARTTSEGVIEDVIQFCTVPQDEVDFTILSEYCSNSPNSVFTQKRFLNVRTSAGNCSIIGDTYSCTENGRTLTHTIQNEAEYQALLRNHFSLNIPV